MYYDTKHIHWGVKCVGVFRAAYKVGKEDEFPVAVATY